MTWYHAANGQQAGPFTEEQFRALIASGIVQPTTLVWEARLPNWIPLAQVPPEILPQPALAAPGAMPGFAAPPVTPGGVLCSECGQTFAPDVQAGPGAAALRGCRTGVRSRRVDQ